MIINLLSFLNFLLGAISLLPCLMAGLMSMDSPQAQHSVVAHIMMIVILSFPFVCWICSALPYYFPKYSFYISLFPIVEMVLFFGIMYFLGDK
jgi:hypothetical protein